MEPPAAGVHDPNADTAAETDTQEAQADGTLRKLEASSSAGGSHSLESDGAEPVEYALASDDLDLDEYLGVKVRAFGYLVDGTSDDEEGYKLMNAFLIGAL